MQFHDLMFYGNLGLLSHNDRLRTKKITTAVHRNGGPSSPSFTGAWAFGGWGVHGLNNQGTRSQESSHNMHDVTVLLIANLKPSQPPPLLRVGASQITPRDPGIPLQLATQLFLQMNFCYFLLESWRLIVEHGAGWFRFRPTATANAAAAATTIRRTTIATAISNTTLASVKVCQECLSVCRKWKFLVG